ITACNDVQEGTVTETRCPVEPIAAPYWTGLTAAEADGKLVKREVKNDIAPFADALVHDTEYRSAVEAFVARGRKEGPSVTRGAKKAIRELLDANPKVYDF